MEIGDLGTWAGVVLGAVGTGLGAYNWWEARKPIKPKIECVVFIDTETTSTDRPATSLYDMHLRVSLVQPMFPTMLKGIEATRPESAILYCRDKTRHVIEGGGGVDPNNASSRHVRGDWVLGHDHYTRVISFYISVPEGTRTGDFAVRLHFHALGPVGFTGAIEHTPDMTYIRKNSTNFSDR